MTTTPLSNTTVPEGTTTTTTTSIIDYLNRPQKAGRWSLDERLLFLFALSRFGKGRWKKMSVYLKDR